MANPNSSAAPGGPFPAGSIEQLLVMHCLKEDSVLGREGFSVRATSPGAADPATLDWALRLESYELPLDMKSGRLLANQAPRRLALVPGPSGRIALVHTAYLPEDTVGRSHSFISQILLLPELGAIPAVTTWGSPDWQTEEYPRGETKSLSPLEHLPGDCLIDEAALTAFLSGGAATADQSLARSIYPVRVESSPETRRRWIRAALHGFLRTGEPSATRTRVCILAEPGAVALLVYAIARLLPTQVAGTFSFSTYEPPHTSLRENKVARVIGSYARNGLDRADSDALRRRGYVVDTFRDAYGPELMVEPSWPLEGLLKLVADGDWTAVDEVRALWSRDPKVASGATPASLAEAIRIRPLAAALKAGRLDLEGLLELSRNRFGEGLIRDPELHRAVWEVVRKVWTQPGVRDKFADLLREHFDDLLAEVRDKAQSGPANAWREGWEALKPLVPTDRRAGKLAMVLEAIGASAGAAALSNEDRVALLREWSQSAPPNTAMPSRLQWLLCAPDLPGFRGLARSSGVEPHLIGLAACIALSGAAGWEPGPGVLKDLTDEQFLALVEALATFPEREAVFGKLRSNGELIKLLAEWLIRTPARIPPERVEELLWEARCYRSLGHEFWLEDKHLESLLDRLATDSQLSRKIWNRLIGRIALANFDEGSMPAEIETLAAARERFPGSMADEDLKRLDGWNTLKKHFAKAPKPPVPGTAAKLKTACDAVGQDRDTLVGHWFDKWVLRASDDLDRKRRNESLGRALLGFHESENAACAAALKLADDAKDSVLRGECKTDLFNSIVSEENRDRLARWHENDLRGTSIHPRLQSRDSVGSKGRGKKGLGVGKLRLPPEATRYVGAFVGGGVFTALLLLLLSPLILAAIESISNRQRSDKTVQQDPLAARVKKLDDESKRLDAMQKQLEIREKNVAKNESARSEAVAQEGQPQVRTPISGSGNPRDPKVREPAPDKATSSSSGDQPALDRSGEDDLILKLLNAFVIDRPLRDGEQFSKAFSLASELAARQPGSSLSRTASSVKKLLTKFSFRDVPTDINAKGREQDPFMMDFAFLRDGKDGSSVLASLRCSNPNNSTMPSTISFYFFDVQQGLSWKRKVSGNQYDILTSSLSGEYFVVGRRQQDQFNDLFLNQSSEYYELKTGKGRKLANSTSEGKNVEFRPETSARLAISDDGKRLAYAESSSPTRPLPRVMVYPLMNEAGQPRSQPNLEGYKNDLSGSDVMGISFDHGARTLVVGFIDKPFLLAFDLTDAKLISKKISFNGPVSGWAHSFDGKRLAGVSNNKNERELTTSIIIEDLEIPSNPGTSKVTSLEPPRSGTAELSCVAFSPKGTILATGDRDGVVAIRLQPFGEPNRGREVIRLAHVGPIQKLAFSPDGHVLAALSRSTDDKGGVNPRPIRVDERIRPGIIRVWVTKEWELD